MYAVASCVLGGVAGSVGGAQNLGRAFARCGDRDEADADAQREGPLPPRVAKVSDRTLELPGDFFRLRQRTVFQQDAEFIAAEARKRVAAAQLTVEHAADLAEQVVPRLVAAGIVHGLESVQVQIAQGVLGYAACGLRRQPRQALLELPPADQARKGVVSGLVVEFAGHAPPLG